MLVTWRLAQTHSHPNGVAYSISFAYSVGNPPISFGHILETQTILFACLFGVSDLLNLGLGIYALRLIKKLKKPVPDQSATELLRDLMNGGAVTVLSVVDPKSIFLHSPRSRQ